ncbi:MAG: sulfite exporter TauE/SafE family protein [Oligoflexia bacterium]|nr:sulfite exporter TauE/SafE family protein [Oligoflexia bacterium]
MQSITDFLSSLLSPAAGGIGILQALLAIGVAYLGGILSSLTPCVYPMIPITVSVVGNAEGTGRRAWHEVWIRGLAYVAGMAVIYSFLGVLAGLTGKVFGSFTNTAGWYVGLGLIMTLASLVMLDVIPFDPLVWWEGLKRKFHFGAKVPRHQHPTAHEKRELSFLGAFSLGASSGFIAAPCTTPVLTSILAYIAKTQSVGLGLALMLSFSLGLGTLLLVIAAFAGALKVLPRSGKWMKSIKVGSGLILLVFAEYLFFRAGSLGGF